MGEICKSCETSAENSRQALRLEYLTIGWNVVEGVVSVAAGAVASVLALTAFGIDSFIEVAASCVMVWRLAGHGKAHAEMAELRARRLIGISFFALGTYILIEAALDLYHRSPPENSLIGIIIAVLSAIVMPFLGRAKRRLAGKMEMSSLASESAQTSICGYLSLILLASLLLHWMFGWWWSDAVGALAMVPIIMKEGVESFRGKECRCR